MFHKLKAGLFILFSAAALVTALNVKAQGQAGPCLLGVGNCPQVTQNTGSKASKLYEGAEAKAITASINYGARYLIILSREWDYDRKCYVEERAWVSSIRADQNDRIVVEYGPRVRVSVNNTSWTTSQVNQAEIYNQQARSNIASWQKYEAEKVAPYLNNPTYQKWAQGEYQRAEQWVAYYKNIIVTNNKGVAASAP